MVRIFVYNIALIVTGLDETAMAVVSESADLAIGCLHSLNANEWDVSVGRKLSIVRFQSATQVCEQRRHACALVLRYGIYQ